MLLTVLGCLVCKLRKTLLSGLGNMENRRLAINTSVRRETGGKLRHRSEVKDSLQVNAHFFARI